MTRERAAEEIRELHCYSCDKFFECYETECIYKEAIKALEET